ncbi:MAG: hypothetical protein WBV94_34795 [Blastocatellia bacterium]
MTILDLLNKANEAYPDGLMSVYYDQSTGEEKPDDGADGLALFIVREIHSICFGTNRDEPVGQDVVDDVARAIEKAAFELQAVADHIKIPCESEIHL